MLVAHTPKEKSGPGFFRPHPFFATEPLAGYVADFFIWVWFAPAWLSNSAGVRGFDESEPRTEEILDVDLPDQTN
jgi:hypothetical protein